MFKGNLWTDAPGWLGRFVRWDSSNNGFPLQWHLLGGIVAIGAAAGRRLWVRYDSKPIWLMQSVALVGRSGLGKGWIMGETSSLVEDALEQEIHITDGGPSPESLATIPKTEADGITQSVPEILVLDEMATGLSKRDYMQSMIPRLATLLQNGERPYEDPRVKNSRRLKNLMWILFAGTTEDFMEMQMDPNALGGGFPARILWGVAHSTERLVTGRPGFNDEEERKRLALELYKLTKLQGEIEVDSASEAALVEIQKVCHKEEEGDHTLAGYWSRKPRSILRLAGIASVARGEREISLRDLTWAQGVLDLMEEPMMSMFERVRSAKSEKINLYALQRLRDAGPEGLTFGRWFHDVRYRIGDKDLFEKVVANLKESGRVAETPAKRTPRYRVKESSNG